MVGICFSLLLQWVLISCLLVPFLCYFHSSWMVMALNKIFLHGEFARNFLVKHQRDINKIQNGVFSGQERNRKVKKSVRLQIALWITDWILSVLASKCHLLSLSPFNEKFPCNLVDSFIFIAARVGAILRKGEHYVNIIVEQPRAIGFWEPWKPREIYSSSVDIATQVWHRWGFEMGMFYLCSPGQK